MNKNKHISSKGPTPNTNRTIFAVLGVGIFSPLESMSFEFALLLDFPLDIAKIRLLKYILAIINYVKRNFEKVRLYYSHNKSILVQSK